MKPKPKISISRQDGAIYLLTSPSGKQYVGQSWDYERRMAGYRRNKGRGQPALHRAINKHGWDNFAAVALVVGVQTQDALDATETAFIALLNTLSPCGYNLKRGGMGGKHHEESKTKMSVSHLGKSLPAETRKKMSESMRGEKNHNFGRSPSAETRAKISASLQGKLKSPETCAKMSASRRGKKNPNFGKSPSPETRAKMRAAKLGKHHTAETKAKIGAKSRGRTPPNKGKTASPETIAKMSASLRGEKNPNFGKPTSAETKVKISASLQGKTASPETCAKMSASQKARWARERAAVKTATTSLL